MKIQTSELSEELGRSIVIGLSRREDIFKNPKIMVLSGNLNLSTPPSSKWRNPFKSGDAAPVGFSIRLILRRGRNA